MFYEVFQDLKCLINISLLVVPPRSTFVALILLWHKDNGIKLEDFIKYWILERKTFSNRKYKAQK